MRRLVALMMMAVVLAGCAGNNDNPDEEPEELVTDEPVFAESVPVVLTENGTEAAWDFTGPYSRTLTEGIYDILAPQHIVLTSDIDGATIEMGLWLPDGEGPWPVLMFSSPYFSVGGRPVTNPGGPSSSVGMLINEIVPHGYAFATHAVRGTAGSGGCNDLMGPLETLDIDQAVTWLGTQDWSNGKVGMTGVSYEGSTPWGVASLGNEHLATIIPISGVPDMHGLMYRNGSSETRGPLLLNALYIAGGVQSAPTDASLAERVICPDAYQGLALSGVATVAGTDPTGWWQERNRKAGVEANYQGSVFSIQGMQDWNVDPSQVIPWVDELDKQGIKTKQLLGQWGHSWPDTIGDEGQNAGPMRADWKEILLRWLNSELKGQDVDTGPPVQVRDQLGRWRNELTFPPRDATWTTWHLGNGGLLSPEPGSPETIRLRPIVPFMDVGNSAVDVAAELVDFVLPKTEGELLISGLPKVHVAVTPQGPGGYIGAYLYNRAPNGDLAVIGWTSMNLAFANGGTERQEVIPGQTIRAMMEIQPMDAAIPEGHELVLRVWVNTDADRLPTVPPGIVDLELGHSLESTLILPTIERTDEYYFEPPVPSE